MSAGPAPPSRALEEMMTSLERRNLVLDRQISREVKREEALDAELERLRAEVAGEKQRQRDFGDPKSHLRGVGAVEMIQELLRHRQRKIRLLIETKARIVRRHDRMVDDIVSMREEINNLRRDHMQQEDMFQKRASLLELTKNKLALALEQANDLGRETEALRDEFDQEMASFERESTELAAESKMAESTTRSIMEELIPTKKRREEKSTVFGDLTVTQEDILKGQISTLTVDIKTAADDLRVFDKSIAEFQEAFAKITAGMGEASPDDCLAQYMNSADEQYKIVRRIQQIDDETASLEDHLIEIEREMRKVRREQARERELKRQALERRREALDRAREEIALLQWTEKVGGRLLSRLCTVVNDLFFVAGCQRSDLVRRALESAKAERGRRGSYYQPRLQDADRELLSAETAQMLASEAHTVLGPKGTILPSQRRRGRSMSPSPSPHSSLPDAGEGKDDDDEGREDADDDRVPRPVRLRGADNGAAARDPPAAGSEGEGEGSAAPLGGEDRPVVVSRVESVDSPAAVIASGSRGDEVDAEVTRQLLEFAKRHEADRVAAGRAAGGRRMSGGAPNALLERRGSGSAHPRTPGSRSSLDRPGSKRRRNSLFAQENTAVMIHAEHEVADMLKEGVTENNVLRYLGAIEDRVGELLADFTETRHLQDFNQNASSVFSLTALSTNSFTLEADALGSATLRSPAGGRFGRPSFVVGGAGWRGGGEPNPATDAAEDGEPAGRGRRGSIAIVPAAAGARRTEYRVEPPSLPVRKGRTQEEKDQLFREQLESLAGGTTSPRDLNNAHQVARRARRHGNARASSAASGEGGVEARAGSGHRGRSPSLRTHSVVGGEEDEADEEDDDDGPEGDGMEDDRELGEEGSVGHDVGTRERSAGGLGDGDDDTRRRQRTASVGRRDSSSDRPATGGSRRAPSPAQATRPPTSSSTRSGTAFSPVRQRAYSSPEGGADSRAGKREPSPVDPLAATSGPRAPRLGGVGSMTPLGSPLSASLANAGAAGSLVTGAPRKILSPISADPSLRSRFFSAGAEAHPFEERSPRTPGGGAGGGGLHGGGRSPAPEGMGADRTDVSSGPDGSGAGGQDSDPRRGRGSGLNDDEEDDDEAARLAASDALLLDNSAAAKKRRKHGVHGAPRRRFSAVPMSPVVTVVIPRVAADEAAVDAEVDGGSDERGSRPSSRSRSRSRVASLESLGHRPSATSPTRSSKGSKKPHQSRGNLKRLPEPGAGDLSARTHGSTASNASHRDRVGVLARSTGPMFPIDEAPRESESRDGVVGEIHTRRREDAAGTGGARGGGGGGGGGGERDGSGGAPHLRERWSEDRRARRAGEPVKGHWERIASPATPPSEGTVEAYREERRQRGIAQRAQHPKEVREMVREVAQQYAGEQGLSLAYRDLDDIRRRTREEAAEERRRFGAAAAGPGASARSSGSRGGGGASGGASGGAGSGVGSGGSGGGSRTGSAPGSGSSGSADAGFGGPRGDSRAGAVGSGVLVPHGSIRALQSLSSSLGLEIEYDLSEMAHQQRHRASRGPRGDDDGAPLPAIGAGSAGSGRGHSSHGPGSARYSEEGSGASATGSLAHSRSAASIARAGHAVVGEGASATGRTGSRGMGASHSTSALGTR